MLKDLSTQFLTNAFFSVDTFFYFSGLLLGFIWFKGFKRNPSKHLSIFAWILFFVHRFVRLSPPYYLAVAFYTFVLRTFLTKMPIMLNEFLDPCETNWWINFLYLTNFIDYKHQVSKS